MSKFTEFLLAIEDDIGNLDFYAYIVLLLVVIILFTVMVV